MKKGFTFSKHSFSLSLFLFHISLFEAWGVTARTRHAVR
jgi:hypothetical protein